MTARPTGALTGLITLTRKTILLLLMVALSCLLLSGCGNNSSGGGGAPSQNPSPSSDWIGTGDLGGGVGNPGERGNQRSRAVIGTPISGVKLTARVDVNQDGDIAPLGETVTVGGNAYGETFVAFSDANGTFLFSGMPITLNDQPLKVALTCEKEGYANNTRTLYLRENTVLAVVLTEAQSIGVIDLADEGETISLVNQGRGRVKLVRGKRGRMEPGDLMQVDIPKDAIPAGVTSLSGSTTYLDPNTGSEIFPGNFLAENPDRKKHKGRAADETIILQSVVLSEVVLKDQNNQRVELTTTKSRKRADNWSTVTMLVPEASLPLLQDQNPQLEGIQVPIYYFDEDSGLWKLHVEESGNPIYGLLVDEEGNTIPQGADLLNYGGDLYAKAEVNHFSWWNVDYPAYTHTVICGKLTDDQGNPLPGAMVKASGIPGANSDNFFSYAYTDSNGIFFLNVKRSPGGRESYTNWRYDWDLKTASAPANNLGGDQRIAISAYLGWNEIACGNSDLNEAGAGGTVNWQDVGSPSLIASIPGTSAAPARYIGTYQVDLSRRITGRIVKENGETPVSGITVIGTNGQTVTTGRDGIFAFDVLPNSEFMVFAYGIFCRQIAAGPDDLDLGDIIIPNHPPVITSVSADPNNPGLNQTVNLSGAAYDPDGDPLTYAWTLRQDEDWSAQGATAAWNGSAQDGVFNFKLTVSDGLAEVSAMVPVFVANFATGNNLKIVVLENSLPVEGARVVLHGTNNTSVQDSKVTNENGEADFGDLGRNRGTFTVAMSPQQQNPESAPSRTINGELNNQSIVLVTFEQVLFSNPIIVRMENFEDRPNYASYTGCQFDLKLNRMPQNYTEVNFQPLMYSNGQDAGETDGIPYYAFQGIYIYEDNLQRDGKLSLLAQTWNNDQLVPTGSNRAITGFYYGWLTDLIPEEINQTEQVVEMNHQGSLVNWVANQPVNLVQIMGKRRGQTFEMTAYNPYQEEFLLHNYGSFWVADRFPADELYCQALILSQPNKTVSSRKSYRVKLGGIPNQLELLIPEVNLSDLTGTDSSTFRWTTSGSDVSKLNMMSLVLYGGVYEINSVSKTQQSSAREVKWTLVSLPVQNIKLPTLPQEISGLMPENWMRAGIGASAFDPLPGNNQAGKFDQLWVNFVKGMKLDEDSQNIFNVSYSLVLGGIDVIIDSKNQPPALPASTKKHKGVK